MCAVKTKSSKRLLSSRDKERISILQYLNIEWIMGSIIFFIIASRLPDGKSEPDYKLALILGLSVYVAGIVNDFIIPKTNALFAGRKAFFQSNQILLVRSAAAAALIALVFCFFQKRQIWIFVMILAGAVGLYFYLFSKILTGPGAGLIRKFILSLIFITGCWCITWLGIEIPRESMLAGFISLLIVWQNTLLRVHYIQHTRQGKVQSKGNSGNYIRIITIIIIVLGAAGCYFTTFRFSQRLLAILMLTSVFQYMLTLGKHSLYRKNYAQMLIEWIVVLPFTIL